MMVGLCTVAQEAGINGPRELGMCSSVQRQLSSSKTSVLTLLSSGTWGHVVLWIVIDTSENIAGSNFCIPK
jgi:hypothetical protein